MYDKKEYYKEKIAPLIKEIKLLCDREHIPMFISIPIQDDGRDTIYQSSMLSCAAVGVKLSDDHLPKFACILNGFDVVPYKSMIGKGFYDPVNYESITPTRKGIGAC